MFRLTPESDYHGQKIDFPFEIFNVINNIFTLPHNRTYTFGDVDLKIKFKFSGKNDRHVLLFIISSEALHDYINRDNKHMLQAFKKLKRHVDSVQHNYSSKPVDLKITISSEILNG